MMPLVKVLLIIPLTIVVFTAQMFPLFVIFLNLLTIGQPFHTEIIERLNDPVQVVGWNKKGIILWDGSVIQLPPVENLQSYPEALEIGTKNGVEIDSNGQVYGLIPIYRAWCGNDPVSQHLARGNLSRLLLYLQDGGLFRGLDPPKTPRQKGLFVKPGWDPGEYYDFQRWEKDLEARHGLNTLDPM